MSHAPLPYAPLLVRARAHVRRSRAAGKDREHDGRPWPHDGTHDFALSGHICVVGGGIQQFISPHMALDAGVATGKFDHTHDPTSAPDLQMNNNTSLHLRVGVNWHP